MTIVGEIKKHDENQKLLEEVDKVFDIEDKTDEDLICFHVRKESGSLDTIPVYFNPEL